MSSLAATRSSSGSSPFAGLKWYVDPNTDAARQAASWRASRPADAAQMDKIAGQPQGGWFGDWNSDVAAAVSSRVTAATNAGAIAQLVAYNIPFRDCGGLSGGGAASPVAYQTWIRAFAAGIGSRRAVVILEPDALASMDCLSTADRTTRLSLLSDAVAVLGAHPGVSTYVDAGHAGWQSASVMASRLKQAAVAKAQGFSLNVSNFDATSAEISYGHAISVLASGRHFVIDTSRNGLGSDGQWCNPAGRALGVRPTALTGDGLIDAYLWIKTAGNSDGACNGGPAAGVWWPDYALGLAQRAAY